MHYFFLIFVFFPAWGDVSALKVKESALKFHPLVLAALEKWKASSEKVNVARGAFDTKVVSNYKRQTKDDWSTTLSRTQIEKPLRIANSKIYVGSEQISNPSGLLAPIYNTGNPTTQTGNYTLLGMQFSLWKNLSIDPARAALSNAKLDARLMKGEKTLTMLEMTRLSQLAYWEWVTAQKVTHAYEELLKNGETRNDYLVARNKKGDIAQIVITENEQYVASRKKALQAAKERLLRAEYALSLFFRDDTGQPVTLNPEETFEDYPSNLSPLIESLNLNADLDELMRNRADIQNLVLNSSKTQVALELAEQDLRPQIDLAAEYFQRTVSHPNMPRDYLMILAQVSIPIERNLGHGQIAAARASQLVASKEMLYGQEKYRAEVMATRKALSLYQEQVIQSEIEYTKSKELVVSESYKFKTGGGNLFLVNLREESQTSAEASFYESKLAFMTTFLTYQALTSIEAENALH